MGSTTTAARVPLVKGLNCPGCGASLTMRAAAHTLTIVCESCTSILDARDPNFQVLQKFEAKRKVDPKIPLGARGGFEEYTYEVIGFQVRTIVVEGVPYSWHEYLLFNPYKGFRYLTVYNDHWNFVRTVRAVPQEPTFAGKPTKIVRGERFKHFQTATAKTTYVLGEFPWQVRVGDAVEVRDYISPPQILSSESFDSGQGWQETTWSLGQYMTGRQVWQAFKLQGQAPRAEGIFANQPSPYKGRVKGIWITFALALFALFVTLVVMVGMARDEQVFRGSYAFQPGGADEKSFVTDVFELKGERPATVEVRTRANVSNDWVFLSYALIDEQTGRAWDFGREVSYYFGRDSDGSWTEGSQEDTARLPMVPPGRYYLRVEPEKSTPAPVTYEIQIKHDVPEGLFIIMAFGALLVPPVIFSIRAAAFEGKRWQESDYASSDEDDDDDDE